MIGVLIVSHSNLSKGLRDSVEMIMGENDKFDVLGFYEDESFETLKEDFYQKVVDLDSGEGVLVFVDLLGATPYNVAAMCFKELQSENHNIRVVSGVNLAMVIESLGARSQSDCTLDFIYQNAIDSGVENIKEMTNVVNTGY
ncbi:PTS sugar transporter subunit IIA [Enterococcus sp. AZ163]|uniref:PTS sugar transporter subunit IIA n=1 Tax=Enterococcus sp. AZ163 TaxID=2774638 RepID=UPI003D2690DE